MQKRIYLKEAIEVTALEGKKPSKSRLATVLGITRQAIGQWNTRRPLAPEHVKTLKELYPMEFGNRY